MSRFRFEFASSILLIKVDLQAIVGPTNSICMLWFLLIFIIQHEEINKFVEWSMKKRSITIVGSLNLINNADF